MDAVCNRGNASSVPKSAGRVANEYNYLKYKPVTDLSGVAMEMRRGVAAWLLVVQNPTNNSDCVIVANSKNCYERFPGKTCA